MITALFCALAALPSPAQSSEVRLGLYQNLFAFSWQYGNGPYATGSMPPGLVDFGELRIQPAFPSGKFRLVGFSGYRKGGWMTPTTQPNPGFHSYDFWHGAGDRLAKGRPSNLKFTKDQWRLKLSDAWPYAPTPESPQFLFRSVTYAEDRQDHVETKTESWTLKESGSYSFRFEAPLEFFKGSIVKHWSMSGAGSLYRAAVIAAQGKPVVPKESFLYFSEFEPFLFDPAFPLKLKEALKDREDLEYWVLARTNQIIRVRAVYRGLQQLKFREMDMSARRYDIAGFRRDDRGKWDLLATVWVDKEDWKFILADNTLLKARGLIGAEGLFRIEPEKPSDLDWVYPPFHRNEKYLKEPIEPGGTGPASKGGGTP